MLINPETQAAVVACMKEALRLNEAEAATITAETGAADLPQWTSLAHVRLILTLEERFGVAFADDQVVEMVSVGGILAALDHR